MKTLREYKEAVLSVLLEQDRFQNTAKALLGTSQLVSASALLNKLTQPDTTVQNIFDLETEWETMSGNNDYLTPLLYTLANSKSVANVVAQSTFYLDLHYTKIHTAALEAAATVFTETADDNRLTNLKAASHEQELVAAIQLALTNPSMQGGWLSSKPQAAIQLESLLKQLPTPEQDTKQAACLETLQKAAYKQQGLAKTESILKQYASLRETLPKVRSELQTTKAKLEKASVQNQRAQERAVDLLARKASLEIAGNAMATQVANLQRELGKKNRDSAHLADLRWEYSALEERATSLKKELEVVKKERDSSHSARDKAVNAKEKSLVASAQGAAEIAALQHKLRVTEGYRHQDGEIIHNLKKTIADLKAQFPLYRDTIARQEAERERLQTVVLKIQRDSETLRALTPAKPAQVVEFKGKKAATTAPQPIKPSYSAVASKDWPTLAEANLVPATKKAKHL